MGLLDSILSAVSGKSDVSGEAAPLIRDSQRSPRTERRLAGPCQQIFTERPG